MTGDRGGRAYAELLSAVREIQDAVAGLAAPPQVLQTATASLQQAAALLAGHVAEDGQQHAGRRLDLPGRGHPVLVPFVIDVQEDDFVEGRVTFTRSHLSGGGRVHAGMIALLFGEVLGVLSIRGGRFPSRNAALHVNYRSATPTDQELRLVGRMTGVDGRKVSVQGELWSGDVLAADAQGLYVRPVDAPPIPADPGHGAREDA